jgi:hypothetical protein
VVGLFHFLGLDGALLFVVMVDGGVHHYLAQPWLQWFAQVKLLDVAENFHKPVIKDCSSFVTAIGIAKANTHGIRIELFVEHLLARAVLFAAPDQNVPYAVVCIFQKTALLKCPYNRFMKRVAWQEY